MSYCATDLTTDSEALERLDRACDFFGDTRQRHRDRLVLEQSVWSEEYAQGRMALILDCDFPVVCISQPDAARFIHSVASASNGSAFIVLKADVHDCHKLQGWDEKLMLVTDIHLVQGPEGVIPSRVGLYRIYNEGPKFGSNLPLFQSAIEPMVYKSFARIADWESIPTRRDCATFHHDLVEHEVESTSKVVQRVSGSESNFVGGEQIFPDVNAQEILPSLRVVINSRSVTIVVSPECQSKLVNVRDVLVGPLNLFV
jgi:hypothetical protein